MGCGDSKLDDLPAVALCHNRTHLLADAIRHRYALADAHASYSRSLVSVGAALHRFLAAAAAAASLPSPPLSPLLPLPPRRKGVAGDEDDPPAPPISSVRHSLSHSHSGSHIHFHSDSGSDADSPLHSDHEAESPAETAFANLNYARSHPAPPTVAFEQAAQSPDSVHSGYLYSDQNSRFYSYSYPHSYCPYGYDYSSGGAFGFGSPPPAVPPSPVGVVKDESVKAPPSPPRNSTWDFLNPFESLEGYFRLYTPSRSSKEVREEEGIPDLEDKEYEVVKEAYGDQKHAASISASAAAAADTAASPGEYFQKLEGKHKEIGEKTPYEQRKADEDEEGGDVPVVEKNVVADEGPQVEDRHKMAVFATPRKYHGIFDFAGKINAQFGRASDTLDELSKLLEVGKLLHHQKISASHVSPRRIRVMGFCTPKSEDFLVFEEEKSMDTRNLSLTLQKLYIWEKKLYEEVKAEEKMRVLHDRKCKRLKHLDEWGAEAHKVESTQAKIRKLATKIRITIQAIESISKKVNRLRDEELWPQINELIQGFVRMWRVMLECHRTQCHAISDAKNLDSIASRGKLSDARMELTLQLELELLEWIGNFSAWIIAQKNYVKALNGWLFLCLNYEPEETPDGIVPFSPGRLGAPPVFVACNYWSQAMDSISEREVIGAMKAFAVNLRHFWEQQSLEHRQRLMANSDIDSWHRTREKETQTMNKVVDALNKKLVLVSGQDAVSLYRQVVNHSNHGQMSTMQSGLRQVFTTLENFTACSMKAYEELNERSEEERLARLNTNFPESFTSS